MSGPRVILVEDESLIAMMMEDLLTELGCEVVGAFGQVSAALEWLAAQSIPPDGALLDVNLGGEMVFPVAEALRARAIPFVFATGYGALSDPRFADSPLINKPVNLGALAPHVRGFAAGD
jgi:CheY-like chemotaxis protein